jgi:hypothetical protein
MRGRRGEGEKGRNGEGGTEIALSAQRWMQNKK